MQEIILNLFYNSFIPIESQLNWDFSISNLDPIYKQYKYKIMVYGYIRVSSDKQTVENQRFEINKFCKHENIQIDGWIEETISGTKAYDKRQLGKLLLFFHQKRIDKTT